MKKIFLGLLLATTLLSFAPVKNAGPKAKVSHSINKINCKYGQCQATAKSTGVQCKHCVSKEGDRYCFQHK